MMKRRTQINVWLLLLLGWFLLPQLAQAQAPDTRPSAGRAQPLWSENCTPCHGPRGQGDGPTSQTIEKPLPNFTDPAHARQMVPVEIFSTIKNGRIENLMPPWGNRLSDAEMWDLTARVWSLGVDPQGIVAGASLYDQQCAACHGQTGQGDGPSAATQLNDFSDLSQMGQVSQVALQANYQAEAAHRDLTLTEAESWQVLDYVRSFSLAVPQRNGILRGQVINQTSNEPTAALDLTLLIFEGNAVAETLVTQADEAGHYTFNNLPTDPGLLFVLEGSYQGVVYSTQPLHGFSEDRRETNLDLEVYEPTTSNEGITITQLHYIVATGPAGLSFLQIFVVGNRQNQTYIGDENGHTFAFALPENARNQLFQGDEAARFIETESGYIDTSPILPGEQGLTIAVTYDIPYSGDRVSVEMPLPAEVGALSLLLNNQAIKLQSNHLEFAGERNIQGNTFSLYDGGNLTQGETLTLEFSNLAQAGPAAAPTSTLTSGVVDQDMLRWLILSLGGLAILASGLLYPYLAARSAPLAGADQPVEPAANRQRLLLTLARLDDAFAAGEVAEPLYRAARAGYMARLAALVKVHDQD